MKKCMTKTLGRGLSPDDRDTLIAKRDNRDTLLAKAAGSTHARTHHEEVHDQDARAWVEPRRQRHTTS